MLHRDSWLPQVKKQNILLLLEPIFRAEAIFDAVLFFLSCILLSSVKVISDVYQCIIWCISVYVWENILYLRDQDYIWNVKSIFQVVKHQYILWVIFQGEVYSHKSY